MERLDFSHERDLALETLLTRVESYYPDADFVLIRKAFQLAQKAHQGQKRSSGEDYIIHPLNVAAILAKLRMDTDTIIAAILHDTIEDCDVSPKEIETKINPMVAQLVVGLTKISKIQFKTREEHQVENFRKMVVAMAQDIRVIIIKLADRMHNMRTLQYVNEEKQKRIADETLEIYVPLASRLGIHSVKSELEDLCLRFLKPDIYYRLAKKVDMKQGHRDVYIREVIELLQEKLIEFSVEADLRGRPKHFYSIYRKMRIEEWILNKFKTFWPSVWLWATLRSATRFWESFIPPLRQFQAVLKIILPFRSPIITSLFTRWWWGLRGIELRFKYEQLRWMLWPKREWPLTGSTKKGLWATKRDSSGFRNFWIYRNILATMGNSSISLKMT